MMLPRPHVSAEILGWSRRRNCMSPGTTEPFNTGTITSVASDTFQVVDDIVKPHLTQPMQKCPRIFEHYTRPFALTHQLRNEIAHAFVTPVKDCRIMIVPNTGVIHHMFEIADNLCCFEVVSARGNERLMHVQCDCKRAIDLTEIDSALGQKDALSCGSLHGRSDLFLGATNVWSLVNIFSQLCHK